MRADPNAPPPTRRVPRWLQPAVVACILACVVGLWALSGDSATSPKPATLLITTATNVPLGMPVTATVDPQGCSPAPIRYTWSVSPNGRLVSGNATGTVWVVFDRLDSGQGSVFAVANDGPCLGVAGFATLGLGGNNAPTVDAGLSDDAVWSWTGDLTIRGAYGIAFRTVRTLVRKWKATP